MTGREGAPRARARRSRLFATTAPGLGRMLRRQLDAMDGIDVTGTGFDGHADIVFFEADRAGRGDALRSRLAEDVFADVGRGSRSVGSSAAAIASMAWQPDAVQRALSVWADEVRPLAGSMTYRVVARVLGDSRLKRTELRRAMAGLVARDKPRWRVADRAQLEFWISEFHDGQYVAGLRLTGASHPSAETAWPGTRSAGALPAGALPAGALPAGTLPAGALPTGMLPRVVAAAMVDLAGSPGPAGQPGSTLLDPCCGPGPVLAEALAAGWAAEGTDTDAAAIEAAARNAPGASVQLGDARCLLMPDDSVGACVSSLPQPLSPDWAEAALAEMSRVTRSGGAVVLLASELPRPLIPGTLRLRRQVPLRLAGTDARIWVFRRA